MAARFVQFTDQQTGAPFWINPEHVVGVFEHNVSTPTGREDGASITTVTGYGGITANERPAAVVAKLQGKGRG